MVNPHESCPYILEHALTLVATLWCLFQINLIEEKNRMTLVIKDKTPEELQRTQQNLVGWVLVYFNNSNTFNFSVGLQGIPGV